MTPLEARFWAKVQKRSPEQCWPWTGYVRSDSGHGATTYKSMCILAHRKAWILTHGPISSSLCVNHRCDNALCCNPAHMYLGTRADNMIDRWHLTPAEERTSRGRPHVLTEAELEKLWQRRREGAKLKECAVEFGIHIATVCRYITERRKQAVQKFQAARLAASRKTAV